MRAPATKHVTVIATWATTLLTTAHAAPRAIEPELRAEPFAPGVITSGYSDVRLTLSPDGRTALWFSRDRPGGPGGYDIWISRREGTAWQTPHPAPFDSSTRDFDPAFSADGRFVYFASDRPGGAGGDDLYRVPVTGDSFGAVENLGAAVNTPRNEWAPMLAPDNRTLLFSSDGHAGPGRMDLCTARARHGRFVDARPLPGAINTAADEFDATFLRDGVTVVFTRSADLERDPVTLHVAARVGGLYLPGDRLPDAVNTPGGNSYAPMLDWSSRDRITFTTRRPADSAAQADVYTVRLRARR